MGSKCPVIIRRGPKDNTDQRLDVLDWVAVAIPADCHEIRNVAEQRAKQIAGEHNSIIGNPNDQRICRLPTRSPRHLEPATAQRQFAVAGRR